MCFLFYKWCSYVIIMCLCPLIVLSEESQCPVGIIYILDFLSWLFQRMQYRLFFFFNPIMLHHQALQNLVAWNNHCLLFLIGLWAICTVLLVWGGLRWSQLGSLLCLGQLVGQLGAGESEDKLHSALSDHGLAQTCSLGEGRRKRERIEVCKGH